MFNDKAASIVQAIHIYLLIFMAEEYVEVCSEKAISCELQSILLGLCIKNAYTIIKTFESFFITEQAFFYYF